MPQPHSTSRIRVRYAETDQMGVAYHANYLVWCEIGRTDLIRALGTTYAGFERQGIRLAVAEASLRYAAPARYDDELIVETTLERAQSRFLTFSYRLVLERPAAGGTPTTGSTSGSGSTPGTVLATATTVLVSIDHAGRTRAMPARVRDAFVHLTAERTLPAAGV